jgi:hypothetical protein
MTIITPTGVTGINSITSSGNSLSFQNASGASIDVSGLKVAADSMNVSGIVTASGIVVSAGSTSAPSISPSGDSNTGIFFPSPDTIAFGEGGAEAFRVDSSGRLGIGTNNPSTEFEVFGTGTVASFRGTGGSGFIGIKDEDDGTLGFIGVDGGSIKLQTSGNSYADKLVVDSSGRVTTSYQPFVSTTSISGSVSGNSNHIWGTSGYVFTNRGNHWDASAGRFTAPVDGVYYVSAGIRYSSISVTPIYIYIYFAASYQASSGQPILLWSPETESGGTYRPRILTSLMYMRANDYVEPRLYVTNGTITIDGGATNQTDCFLNIFLMG